MTQVRVQSEARELALLTGRIRVGLTLVIVSSALFALADLRFEGRKLVILYLIKICGIGVVGVCIPALRRCWTQRQATLVGVVGVVAAVLMTTMSGVITRDTLSTPILCITIVLVTATLIPWGARPQFLVAVISGLAIAFNGWLLRGQPVLDMGYPAVAIVVAFVASIVVAIQVDHYSRVMRAERRRRARTAAALADSEGRYRELFENANDAVFTHDLEGRITSCNRAAERLTGYPRELALRTNILDLLEDDSRQEVAERLALLRAGRVPEEGEARPLLSRRRMRTRYGRTVVFEVSSHLVYRDGRPVAVEGIGRDVTRRDETECALRESEARLREVASGIPGVVYQLRVEQDGSFSFPLILDSPYVERFGIRAEDVRADPMAVFRAVLPEDRQQLWDMIGAMPDGKAAPATEFRARTPAGEVRWFRASSTRQAVEEGAVLSTGLIIDVTDRKLADESARRLAAIVESSDDAITAISLDGRILSWNRGAQRMYGYEEAEIVGQPATVLLGSGSPEEMNGILRRIERGEGMERLETVRVRKDGALIPVSLTVSPLRDTAGNIAGASSIARDITERVRMEAQLRAARDELEARVRERTSELSRSNELLRREIRDRERAEVELVRAREAAEQANRAKSDFLANVSHEIRTPMNAVLGMTGLLLDSELTREQREFAETVRAASRSLLTLINDLLDTSKVEAGRLDLETQPFDLCRCIEGALDLVASKAAERDIALAYSVDDAVPEVLVGDVGRLRQVLVNLLGNAVRFTDTGEVVVCVAPASDDMVEEQMGEDSGAAAADVLHFSVRDTGIGIPGDCFDRLFIPFSQVDTSTTRRYGGTGLGLALCKRLSQAMGGRIWVESEVGKGSTFHFTIRAGDGGGPAGGSRRGVQPGLAGKTALVVEPNRTHREVLLSRLRAWGMDSVVAASGMDALDRLRGGERFAIGFIEEELKELDGSVLAREIRVYRNSEEMPLVLVGALGRMQREPCKTDGAGWEQFLTRPVKESELLQILNVLLVQERVQGAAPERRASPRLADDLPLRILVAEDNEVNQQVAVRLLARLGYRADVVGNGVEVLRALRRQSYDVIFMDVQMPEMDGFEASRRVVADWESGQRPHIVALTAHTTATVRERCRAAGMEDFVAKPIEMQDLRAALERSAAVNGAPVDRTDREGGEQMPGAEVIDPAILARLEKGQEPGEQNLVVELIDVFLEHAPQGMSALHAAMDRGDVDAVAEAAHRLKSSSGQLGAGELARVSAELETRTGEGSLDDAERNLLALDREFEKARAALIAERERRLRQ